jgi:GntR family transcriptional regulator, galactonate operon transcriptional repressor
MSDESSSLAATRAETGANLTMAVAAELGRKIVGRQLVSGISLPTEPELQDQLGVSRTVVREAIRHLASKGLVSVGPKVGTRVRPSTEWNMLDPEVMEWHLAGSASADFIAALYEMRLIFEPEAARLAATRISLGQKTALIAALDGISTLPRASAEHIAADLAFHRIILESTGNPVLRSFGAMIENSLSVSFSLSWQKAEKEQSLALHRQVAEAITSGDEELAALQMKRLISIAWKEVRLAFVANPA